jgi:phage terminase small subunit
MTEPQPPEPQSSKRKAVSIVPIRQQRPDPPAELSRAEAEIWRTTVRNMRADWFIGMPVQALLRAFCLQCVVADELAARLRAWRKRKGDSQDEAAWRALVSHHSEACKTLLRLATVLRLTPASNRQSIRDARASAPERWPWETA